MPIIAQNITILNDDDEMGDSRYRRFSSGLG